jgi:riboflavin kinase/FMN adenylyltransferase
MRLVRPQRIAPAPAPHCVVTIGGFDGVHVGHQALIARTLTLARQCSLPAMMISFEPLPREFLQADDPPARLTNFRERWRLLSATGLDRLCLLRFDERLQHFTGPQFMQLLALLGARRAVVGHDFRFGHQGEANAEWCARQGSQFGFEVEVMPPVLLDGERVSSRLIRAALAAGDLTRAARLLGRGYSMRGRVRRGAQLGRKLGFPTANIATHRRRLPLSGIFAVRVHLDDARGASPSAWPAVASLGTRPTVNGIEPLLEAFLFDFDGDLYGREIEVEFIAKLRDELKFDALDPLVEQMHRDAAAARRILLG